jgi:glycyl-tRNA synthetase
LKQQPLTFQDAIMALQRYWTERGCVLWQPYYSQVGAGTMNPATFLRVLGPEPWRVAYVEPSIRPDDGRYGENPNRMQQHYQFQVVLKPDPGDPQEQYLGSLVALGIDPLEHDLRFVEDNWRAPALGAWGLGWEVWLDGQEITQFTYFQQAGGLALDPVSVEITYGLERILIALQGVEDFRQIGWSADFEYGDLNLQAEQEHSRYYFEDADIERLREMFEDYEAEAQVALSHGLVLPAHDYLLKCSHTFNILDTRGAVGVTDRAELFGRMRDLARRTAEAYIAQRQALNFPWLERTPWKIAGHRLPAPVSRPKPAPGKPADFLLEIGTEELPAGDLDFALAYFGQTAGDWLRAARLQHEGFQVLGTPRRLVLFVRQLHPRQPDHTETVKGPPAERAYDQAGKPTGAAEGFARSRGVPVEALRVESTEGGRYVVAEVKHVGLKADEVLATAIPDWLSGLHFERSMRWDGQGTSFSRPIRWVLALHGEHVVPLSFAGLPAGRRTRGLRFSEPAEIDVSNPASYFDALQDQGILLDPLQRRRLIERQVRSLARQVDGKVEPDPQLLDEVTNLLEAPTGLRGGFSEGRLELPPQVLIAVMKKHQRCFPVIGGDGTLLPYFIAFRNGGRKHLDMVRQGNEHVIRARFADAAYFIRQDRKRPLEAILPELDRLTFHAQLGSMLDKVGRIERLTQTAAGWLGLSADERQTACRAAHLCKADMATKMVVEMTSLQGEMGRDYALSSGESQATAQAIFEHLLPRYAEDQLPQSRPGIAVGLADRLDTLAGLFAAGLEPTGASDPFALRRCAIGLVQILVTSEIPIDLAAALRQAAAGLPLTVSGEVIESCLRFISARQQTLMLELHRHDVVEACLVAQSHNPAGAAAAARALDAWRRRRDWAQILQSYARCARITRGLSVSPKVQPPANLEAAEGVLFEAVQQAQAQPRRAGSVDDCLNAFMPLIPAITRFFDEVLVMDEDPGKRAFRLSLLQRIVDMAGGVADLSQLEGF